MVTEQDSRIVIANAEQSRKEAYCRGKLLDLKHIWGQTLNIKPTRFCEIAYARIVPGTWQFLDVFNFCTACPQIGPHYRSETELLADLPRFAQMYGAHNAEKRD